MKFLVNVVGNEEVILEVRTIEELVEGIKSNDMYKATLPDGARKVVNVTLASEFIPYQKSVSFPVSLLDEYGADEFLDYVTEDPEFTSMIKYVESMETIRKGAIYRFKDYLYNDPAMLESPTVYSTIINKINEMIDKYKDGPVDGSELYNLFDNLVNGGLILFIDDIPNLSYEEWKDAREIATSLVEELKQQAQYMAYLIKQNND